MLAAGPAHPSPGPNAAAKTTAFTRVRAGLVVLVALLILAYVAACGYVYATQRARIYRPVTLDSVAAAGAPVSLRTVPDAGHSSWWDRITEQDWDAVLGPKVYPQLMQQIAIRRPFTSRQ